METEIIVSSAAANAAYVILQEYLAKGGDIPNIDMNDVEEMFAALGAADRIVISASVKEQGEA
jgi:hypothetical protein